MKKKAVMKSAKKILTNAKKASSGRGKDVKEKSSAKSAKMNGRSDESDIVKLILEDHVPLKDLIETLKSEAEYEEKRAAFEEFAPLLLAHAEPEQKSLYVRMKDERDLREQAFEGDVEHALATQMIEECSEPTDNEDLWMAKVKVLAELVEHHIEEEENEMLKDVKKEFDVETRHVIGQEYINLKEAYAMNNDMPVAGKSKTSTSEQRAH